MEINGGYETLRNAANKFSSWIIIEILFQQEFLKDTLDIYQIKSGNKIDCVFGNKKITKKEDCFFFEGDNFNTLPKVLLNLTLEDISDDDNIILPFFKNTNENETFRNILLICSSEYQNELKQIFQNNFSFSKFFKNQTRSLEGRFYERIAPNSLDSLNNVVLSFPTNVKENEILYFLFKTNANSIDYINITTINHLDLFVMKNIIGFLGIIKNTADGNTLFSFEINIPKLEKVGFRLNIEFTLFLTSDKVLTLTKIYEFARQVNMSNTIFSLSNGLNSLNNMGFYTISLSIDSFFKYNLKKIKLFLNRMFIAYELVFQTYCFPENIFLENKNNLVSNMFSCDFNPITSMITFSTIDLTLTNFFNLSLLLKLDNLGTNSQQRLLQLENFDFSISYQNEIPTIKTFDLSIKPFSELCDPNLFTLHQYCVEACPKYYRKEILNNSCLECTPFCVVCDSEKCLECESDLFFFYENKCSKKKIVSFSSTNEENPYEIKLGFNDTFTESYRIGDFIKYNLETNNNISISYEFNSSDILKLNFVIKIRFNITEIKDDILIKISLINLSENNYFILNKTSTIILPKDFICREGEKFDRENRICRSLIEVNPKIMKTLDSRLIKIKFENQFGEALESLKNKIEIDIDDFPKDDYTYLIFRENNDSDNFYIKFDFKKSLRGNPNIKVYLNFQNEEETNPNFFFSVKRFVIETKMNDYYSLSSSTQSFINTTVKLSSTFNIMGTAIASSVVVVSPGASFSITSLLAIGMIKYLRVLEIDYPPNLVAIFALTEDFSGTWDFLFLKDEKQDGEFDNILENYGVSFYMINNLGKKILIEFVIFIFGVFVLGFELFIKCFRLDKNISFLKVVFNWNLFVYFFFSWIMTIAFFVFLAYRYPTIHSNNGILNFIASIIIGISIIIFLIVIYKKRRGIRDYLSFENSITVYSFNISVSDSVRSEKRLEDETKRLRNIDWVLFAKSEIHYELSGYFLLYKDFKYIEIFQSFFMFALNVRYILFAAIIVFFKDQKIIGVSLLIFINVLMIIYFVFTKPFYANIDNFQFLFNEISVLGANISVLCLSVLQYQNYIVDENILLNLGWAIIFFNSCLWILILLRFIYLLFLGIKIVFIKIIIKWKELVQLIKSLQSKKKKKKKREVELESKKINNIF